jgi:hypothetical protein
VDSIDGGEVGVGEKREKSHNRQGALVTMIDFLFIYIYIFIFFVTNYLMLILRSINLVLLVMVGYFLASF